MTAVLEEPVAQLYPLVGMPKVVYLLAWETDEDDPNPHPWSLDSVEYETFEAAVKAAEERVADENDADFERPWLVVSSVAS